MPTSLAIPIIRVGSVVLSPDITLINVLFVLTFIYNLFSGSAFTVASSFSMIFTCDACFIQEPTRGKMIGKGSRKGKLYQLDHDCFIVDKSFVLASCVPNSCKFSLWHSRLGHPSVGRIRNLHSVLGLDISLAAVTPCDIFPLAKQRCLPITSHNNRCSSIFDLIHLDIWGPLSITC